MDDIKQKRLSILAEIDRLNLKRCNQCNTPNYRITKCCEANAEIRKLGKELLALRNPVAIETHDDSYKGQYDKWKAIAIENGISPSIYGQRVREYKWDFERAATERPRVKKSKLTESQKAVATLNGISMTLALTRIANGWEIDRAITQRVQK